MMNTQYVKILLVSLGLVVFSNAQAVGDALHEAVKKQDVEKIEQLLMEGDDINKLGSILYDHGSPLHVAVRADNQEIASLLLKRGALVDVRDASDHTPLHNASWNGYLDMIVLLLDAGANIHATTYSGSTPLSCARSGRKIEAIQFIEGKLQLDSN
jgi:ankyrin repeat protein